MKTVHSTQRMSVHNPLAEDIADFIQKNYSSSALGLEEISTHFFISRQHLCYLFKKEYGVTIGEFILQIRMEHAKIFFDTSCENISLVSLKCGYEDSGYFSKCFKQYYGISPKAYLSLKKQ